MNFLKKGFVFAMLSVLTMTGMVPVNQAAALSSMAPYDRMVSPHEFYNGAMLDLKPTGRRRGVGENPAANHEK